jgi:hypothetical protein
VGFLKLKGFIINKVSRRSNIYKLKQKTVHSIFNKTLD